MLQASLFDGFAFDLFPFQQDGLSAPEVHIGGREVLQAFVVSAVIVMTDEGPDLRLKVTGQIIVLKQDAVLQGLVPPLDLALGLRVTGGTAHVLDAPIPQPLGQFTCDVR